jgi:Uma2 family endonuclease
MGVTTALLTVEQFAQLPQEESMRCELVQGEIVRMGNSGFLHERIKSNANQVLTEYILQNPIGRVFSETMYKLGARDSPIPDVSLLLNERIPPKATNAVPEGAPDLAFDVVSSESAAFLERRINLYLATGCRLVCVAYPLERTLWTYHANGEYRRLREGQYLEAPDLLPGFRVLVDRFFDGI